MYYRFKNPDYICGTSFYSSDSGDDSEDMADDKTCASKVHRKISEFFKKNPVSDEEYTQNGLVFEAMYGVNQNLWKNYDDAQKQFKNTGTEDEKMNAVIAIGDAAVAIREAAKVGHTVIQKNFPSVTLKKMTAQEVELLAELNMLLKTKMIISGKPAEPQGDPVQMVNDFIHDLTVAKVTGVMPIKYEKNHRIWALFQCAEQNDIDLDKHLELTNDEDWNAVVKQIRARSTEAKANIAERTRTMANKYAVDVFAATINHYKRTVEESEQSLEGLKQCLRKLATFTTSTSVDRVSWDRMLPRFKEHDFVQGLNNGNSLYDNPGKLTKARLISCAGCLFKSYDPTAIFCTKLATTSVPKLIVEIFQLEKQYKVINVLPSTTSTSEHLLHLLFCLGDDYTYMYNRNKIPSSVRNTTFNHDVEDLN